MKSTIVSATHALGSFAPAAPAADIPTFGAGQYRTLVQFDRGSLSAGTIGANAAGGPGVHLFVDATEAVKSRLSGVRDQGLVPTADLDAPSTSLFSDSKENNGASHPPEPKITLNGGGAEGPLGPTAPQGLIGPAGGGIALLKRITFSQVSVPPALDGPVALATLSFTPAVDGTALLSGRGYCNMAELANADNRIVIASGGDPLSAFDGQLFENWGVLKVPRGPNGVSYQPTWTSESTMAVTANTPYTLVLAAKHLGTNAKSDCSGSFTVQVF